ncbi:MAG: EamA family transporter [Myxococcales bacterium]|jgi:drug/metabolite transporter (DMT)-like permease|nr:MAG: EamA family transporter [Myxococcales bacterium]
MQMEWTLVGLVLLSALLHASWNAVTKASRDPLLNISVVSCTGALVAGTAAIFLPLPARAAWPYLAATTLVHFVYQIVLVRAYTLGDLSQVYPIARGLAPLGVALLAALTAGEMPATMQAIGLVLASGAIASLGIPAAGTSPTATRSAVLTAVLISAYTTLDGLGVRCAGSPFSYAAWVLWLYAIPIAVTAAIVRRGAVVDFLRSEGARAAAGGLMAIVGYTVVLWALSQGPMAAVAALRETSVIFATLVGVCMLGERFGRRRILASIALAAGLILVQA